MVKMDDKFCLRIAFELGIIQIAKWLNHKVPLYWQSALDNILGLVGEQ